MIDPMSQVATVVALGALSTFSFTVYGLLPPPQSTDMIPWKDIAGGGSALLMFAAIVVFLRFLREERQARDAMLAAEREARDAALAAERKAKEDALKDERAARAAEREAERKLIDGMAERHNESLKTMGETQMTLMRQVIDGANKGRVPA